MGGPLEALSLAHQDAIPTLHLSNVKLQDLKQIKQNGANLRVALQDIIKGLVGKRATTQKTSGEQERGRSAGAGAGLRTQKGTQQLVYSDAVNDPHHNEPYDKNWEEEEWTRIASAFRAAHPDMDPATEQTEIDKIWRNQHPWYYHAYGPTPLTAKPRTGHSPVPHTPPKAPAQPASKPVPPPVYPDYLVRPVHPNGDDVPPTVLAPPDDGIRDFDGSFAIKAHLPPLGHGRTELDDYQKEVRGSFAVRVFGAFGQPEIEVTRMWGGEVHAFTCTYRGYRKLTGDFQGNVVMTGFKRVFHSEGEPPKILTGMDIPPSGNPKEFDIMTCRDGFSGEVQYFKLHPELVLARMRERYCAGNIPSGHIGACAW